MSIAWHYTSHKAAFAMISEQKIHLSNLRYMNDENEFWWIYDRIPDVLNGMKNVPTNYFNYIKEFRNRKENAPISGCAICFSSNEDDPAQWDRYSQNGRGVSIGFNVVEINALFNDKLKLHKICYDSTEQDRLIKEATTELIEKFKQKNEQEATIKQGVITKFNQIAKLSKKPNFSCEQESRLLEWGIEAKNYSFKTRTDTLVPYVQRDIKENTITKIMLGSKSLPESKFAWEQFLKYSRKGNFSHITVCHSECGLR